MTDLHTPFNEHVEEFDNHYQLAVALEDRVFSGEELSIGGTTLSARHLLTMKSGLIIHLYNIVESTMSRAMKLIGNAVGSVPPRRWSEDALKEWLREYAVSRVAGDDETRLKSVHVVSTQLLGESPLGPQDFKKPSGTWNEKLIATFAKRLGVTISMPPEMWRRIKPRPEFSDESPLSFLAERRNALAHGRRSFEKGAEDLTLIRIRELADIAIDYLKLVIDAFQDYLDKKRFLVTTP